MNVHHHTSHRNHFQQMPRLTICVLLNILIFPLRSSLSDGDMLFIDLLAIHMDRGPWRRT
ncbi:hypothetical protein K503DRAFT_60216 [Rhizopogon vinicolor AM-OR11-026]|uniref:Uncharacterized protein n=1 Tax=Rhizopogon vinicolor AM-OR11-026 TaxID=1314800 RepID=A0A1B7MEP2_9AGAM|nr:hypothetical protein K503DRAFT_128072 [Rhizopogon vinicolor AM-OR11-026]OAX31676.1 hypothetical protein K503DRAFT_60216 [Rhizopogon vinicolor AM-OR11-026]